jgi:hypothetical protein
MHKQLVMVLLSTLLGVSSWARGLEVLNMASPKLREFLIAHPAALQSLTNILSRAFSERTAVLYYFYSENESTPRAAHYYPSDSEVGITIRENQQPADEFICLVFEVLNSESQKLFQELMRKAESGAISRSDFAQETLRVEFKAAQATRDLLGTFRLSKREISKSHNYKLVNGTPKTFEDFLAYTKKICAPERDPFAEYERKYDSLRKR